METRKKVKEESKYEYTDKLSGFRLAAAALSFVWLTALLSGSALAEIPDQGRGWDALEATVDDQIKETMEEYNMPGMTVAVSQKGRLVLYKGYGHAKAVAPRVLMDRSRRLRIGSVSKVVVTAPAAARMMEDLGIDRKTKKVYGSGGALGNTFASDLAVNAARFYPIQAMAIAPDDKVYTWYVDRTRSVGTTRDLDAHSARQSFSLPDGKDVSDICDIAIASDNKVYTWYFDGSVSVGNSRNLGEILRELPTRTNSKGKVQKVNFPGSKSMAQVVGISIAKSNDHVYAWYDDNTFSEGYSLDFTHYRDGDDRYTVGPNNVAGMSYGIRAMGISKDDHVYTWYRNNKAMAGSSSDLDSRRAPYDYSHPSLGPEGNEHDRANWFESMTVQHLLTHNSGIRGTAPLIYAAWMNGTTVADLTYEQIHKYMARTQSLRWRPGTKYDYSNHNFGMWTILFPALSSQSYRNYTIHTYLRDLGLSQGSVPAMRPRVDSLDAKDAWPHSYNENSNTYSIIANDDVGIKLAAGGWTASAGAVLTITNHLMRQYVYEPNTFTVRNRGLDNLYEIGWRRSNRGPNAAKFSHGGALGGGASFVAIFTNGYTSSSGADLSDVHINLNVNMSLPPEGHDALRALADQIALAVPESNISSSYNIWN